MAINLGPRSYVYHPATCRCSRHLNGKPGRHPKFCQCMTCLNLRANQFFWRLNAKRRQSRDAIAESPTREKPVFVRAHWRKQKNFMRRDDDVLDRIVNRIERDNEP